MTIEEFHRAFEPTCRSFYGFVLTSCARLKQACRRQLYWHTANAVFHGLSRSGVRMQASLGLMMKMTTFDEMRKEQIAQVNETIRYMLSAHSDVFICPHARAYTDMVLLTAVCRHLLSLVFCSGTFEQVLTPSGSTTSQRTGDGTYLISSKACSTKGCGLALQSGEDLLT
jgi:hypothetical protein